MVEDRIGYRYAKSIYDLAKEKGMTADALVDMQLISETCKGSRDLLVMLKSPVVPSDAKQAVLRKVFDAHFKSALSRLLMDILVRKGREQYLDAVAAGFIQIHDEEHKVLRGKLTSAFALSAAQINSIRDQMQARTGETFEMEVVVDTALIGGFTLQVGDKFFDGSIASSLQDMTKEFKKNPYIKLF